MDPLGVELDVGVEAAVRPTAGGTDDALDPRLTLEAPRGCVVTSVGEGLIRTPPRGVAAAVSGGEGLSEATPVAVSEGTAVAAATRMAPSPRPRPHFVVTIGASANRAQILTASVRGRRVTGSGSDGSPRRFRRPRGRMKAGLTRSSPLAGGVFETPYAQPMIDGAASGTAPVGKPVGPRVRVLEVAARYLPDLGGIETHIYEVSRRLAAEFEITVLATDRTGIRPAREQAAGFEVVRTRAYPADRDYYLAPHLYGLVRGSGVDVVHCQGIHTPVPVQAMLAARRAGIPYVVTFHTGGHSSSLRSSVRSTQWRALGRLLRGAAALIAVSRFERDMFAERCRIPLDRFEVIRNGGGLPELDGPVVRRPGLIVSSGRLEEYKGHHRVIEAMPFVLRSEPAARLHILGSGPYESALRTRIEALGLGQVVTIEHIPPQQRSMMAELLASASVFAAMSDYEAHPVAVMEALALGVPVVGLDVAGIGDLVSEGMVTGIEPGSPPDVLAAALVAAIRNPAPVQIADLPTWESSAASLGEVYRRVARPTGTRAR